MLVDLGHVEAADEVRYEAGSVPGGSGAELPLFYEEGVGPALVSQVVEEADAHGAASNDYALCLVAHASPPCDSLGEKVHPDRLRV